MLLKKLLFRNETFYYSLNLCCWCCIFMLLRLYWVCLSWVWFMSSPDTLETVTSDKEHLIAQLSPGYSWYSISWTIHHSTQGQILAICKVQITQLSITELSILNFEHGYWIYSISRAHLSQQGYVYQDPTIHYTELRQGTYDCSSPPQ